eukprot:RCo042544
MFSFGFFVSCREASCCVHFLPNPRPTPAVAATGEGREEEDVSVCGVEEGDRSPIFCQGRRAQPKGSGPLQTRACSLSLSRRFRGRPGDESGGEGRRVAHGMMGVRSAQVDHREVPVDLSFLGGEEPLSLEDTHFLCPPPQRQTLRCVCVAEEAPALTCFSLSFFPTGSRNSTRFFLLPLPPNSSFWVCMRV